MSAPHKSIPHHNAFDVLRNSHGVILTELETSRLATALQGVQTIAAILQQRELDVDQDPGDGLTFDSNVAQGLIAALATCAKYAEGIVDTGGLMGQCATHNTPAYAELEAARWRVLEANRKGASEWAKEQQAEHHQNPQPKQAENHTQQAQAAIKDEAPKPARRTVNTSAQHIQ